jgi:hypothetical protein
MRLSPVRLNTARPVLPTMVFPAIERKANRDSIGRAQYGPLRPKLRAWRLGPAGPFGPYPIVLRGMPGSSPEGTQLRTRQSGASLRSYHRRQCPTRNYGGFYRQKPRGKTELNSDSEVKSPVLDSLGKIVNRKPQSGEEQTCASPHHGGHRGLRVHSSSIDKTTLLCASGTPKVLFDCTGSSTYLCSSPPAPDAAGCAS